MGLVNKSLVQRAADGRFDLHPLLHQYATDILDGLDSSHAVRDAHSAYFAAALHDLGESMFDRRQLQALTMLNADIDNAWAAWEWAVEHRQVDRIDQAIFGLVYFLDRQTRFDEGLAAIAAAQASLGTPQNSWEQLVVGRILIWQARLERRLGNRDASQSHFRQSWKHIEEAAAAGEDVRYEQALLYVTKAQLSSESGSLDVARDLLERSLVLFREIDHKYGTSEVLANLAWLSTQKGEHDSIDDYFQKSMDLKRQIGDFFGMADDLYFFASQQAFHQGNLERAETIYEESRMLFQELGDSISIMRALRITDDLHIINGRFEAALAIRQKMMRVYQDLHDVAWIGFRHTLLGEVHDHLGDYENAEREIRQALAILADKDHPFEQAFARWQLGMTLLVEDRAAEARRLFHSVHAHI